jgi:hypothetical protein
MSIAFAIVSTITDEKGKPSTFTVNVPITFSLAQYGEFAVQAATIIDACLSGKLTSMEMCLLADLSGLTGNTIGAASDVEERARFKLRTSEGRPVNVNVPALNESLVVVGDDSLDLPDADVAAMESLLLDGLSVTGGTIIPCDLNEDDLVSLEYAREGFTP